jgi:hypothetical protein
LTGLASMIKWLVGVALLCTGCSSGHQPRQTASPAREPMAMAPVPVDAGGPAPVAAVVPTADAQPVPSSVFEVADPAHALDPPPLTRAPRGGACYVRAAVTWVAGPTPRAPSAAASTNTDPDKEIIRRVIRRNIDAVRICYEDELQRGSRIGARLWYSIAIGSDGEVTRSKAVRASVANDTLIDCVGRTLCDLKFPRLRGGGTVVVTYPFVLTPAP